MIVAVDGVVVGADLDATTGMLMLDAAPGAGAAVTAGFRFDCPVRFDVDRLDVSLEAFGAGRVVGVPLVELVG